MKRLVFLFVGMYLLVGCSSLSQITEEDLVSYEVKQTFDEQVEDDFTFRLVTEDAEYQEGEEVALFGEIIYTGEEEVKIAHASSAILFEIKEQIRNYTIPFAVQEIGIETKLIPGERYREKYLKQGVFTSELDDEEFVEFIEDFKNRSDFPPGYYTVNATTAFYDGTMHREIEAEVDFKVLPKKNGE